MSKQPLFSIEERKRLIARSLNGLDRVEIREFDGLLVDFAREIGATVSIRGLRAVSDFEYEYQMALMNRHLLPSLETLFMVPSVDLTFISSSLVREIARFGGDVTTLVHPEVVRALRDRFAQP
jgi:pantetheine-phosphate adenylyltransferase